MPTKEIKRFNSSGTVGTNGVDFNSYTGLRSYINALDLVATDKTVDIYINGTFVLPDGANFKPLTADNTHRVRFMPEPGLGVNEVLRTTFNQGTGPALSIVRGSYSNTFGSGIDIVNLCLLFSGSGPGGMSSNGKTAGMTSDNIYQNNRIYDTSTNATPSLVFGNSLCSTLFADNLVVVTGAGRTVLNLSSGAGPRNTYVATGSAVGNCGAITVSTATPITDSLFIGFSSPVTGSTAAVSTCFSNTPISTGVTAGITVNTAVGALVINETNDFRPTAGGPLISASSASARNTRDILGNNRGPGPDIGAWQLSPFAPSPTGNITTVTVSGTTVTISGTTADAPVSGTASLEVANVAYNGAVRQVPKAITLGTNTFTVQFTNVPVGIYTPAVTFTNTGGSNAATSSVGNVTVSGAQGTFGSQTIDGQLLTISGTTTGAPTSASMTVPAAATNPNGATTLGPFAVTLDNVANTFTVSATITGVGNYDAPIISFSNANGTSLPMTGTSAFSVIGLSGNPEVPAFVITSVAVSPKNTSATTNTVQFGAVVSGDAGVPQTVFWKSSIGSITGNGLYTPPPQTSVTQTATITATSTIDSSKSDTATVTIPGGTTVVTGVVLTPATATVQGGGTQQLSAAVQGDFSPSQAVTWSTSAGTITNTGLLTVPAAQLTTQTITVTAVSVADFTKSGTATITVAALTPSVTSVAVTPATATVAGNQTQQFTATVTGTNSPATTVTWSTSAGTISTTGLLTVPASTPVTQNITVTATSTADGTKKGTATVTVPAVTPKRTVSIVIGDSLGPLANLTGIKVAIFDEATPDLRNAPKYTSAAQTTDANGVMAITFPSSLAVGDLAGISVQMADGRNFDISQEVT